ncbi:MAG: CBS domain-containing protein, partial [Burkholderiales bacterium]
AETVALMREKGVRRLPVVNDAGALIGIVAAGNLLYLLAQELSGLADSSVRERQHEQETRRIVT